MVPCLYAPPWKGLCYFDEQRNVGILRSELVQYNKKNGGNKIKGEKGTLGALLQRSQAPTLFADFSSLGPVV